MKKFLNWGMPFFFSLLFLFGFIHYLSVPSNLTKIENMVFSDIAQSESLSPIDRSYLHFISLIKKEHFIVEVTSNATNFDDNNFSYNRNKLQIINNKLDLVVSDNFSPISGKPNEVWHVENPTKDAFVLEKDDNDNYILFVYNNDTEKDRFFDNLSSFKNPSFLGLLLLSVLSFLLPRMISQDKRINPILIFLTRTIGLICLFLALLQIPGVLHLIHNLMP